LNFIRFLFWLILVLAIGLLPQQKVAAQKLRGDAVYLKSGSVVTGRIMENDSINGLKIANDCGIWFYKLQEIDSIGPQTTGRFYRAKHKGYVNYSNVGLLFGYENFPIPSLNMIHGYKFRPDLSGGLGIGYEYFDWGVMPVFADVRYFFHGQGFSPFLFGQAGYSITLERNTSNNWGGSTKRSFGGPMLSAGAGIRAGISKNSAFIFSIAYRFQRLSHETINQWDLGTSRIIHTHYNRIAISIGFLFE
jgi:hypothetical protein